MSVFDYEHILIVGVQEDFGVVKDKQTSNTAAAPKVGGETDRMLPSQMTQVPKLTGKRPCELEDHWAKVGTQRVCKINTCKSLTMR